MYQLLYQTETVIVMSVLNEKKKREMFFISCTMAEGKHIRLVLTTEWVNNVSQSLNKETQPKLSQPLLLIFYCLKQRVLNKQAINQHVFIWDSSWKPLDARHEQPPPAMSKVSLDTFQSRGVLCTPAPSSSIWNESAAQRLCSKSSRSKDWIGLKVQ